MKIIGQNTSTTSTKTPCGQQQDMALNISLQQLKIEIPEIKDCESLVEKASEKFGMTKEKVCDSAIGTLSDKFNENKKSKNSDRAMMLNLQNNPRDTKIDSICTCTCPQGKIIDPILST